MRRFRFHPFCEPAGEKSGTGSADATAALIATVKGAMDEKFNEFRTEMEGKARKPATNNMDGVTEPASAVTGKDLSLDVPEEQQEAARWGWRVKRRFHQKAVAAGYASEGWAERLGKSLKRVEEAAQKGYLVPVKKAGQFLSTFEDGGLWAKETRSGEMIPFLREASIILRLPGLQTVSGYGTRMVITRQNSTATAEWVGESESATASSITYDECVLGAHKVMGRIPVSGDLLRLGTGAAAATVGNELRIVMGEVIDDACVNGNGAGKPRGLYTVTPDAQKLAISGDSVQQRINDFLKLVSTLRKAKIPNAKSGVYLMGITTQFGLAGLRGTDAYVFEEMRNLESPTLNGRPVFESLKFEGIGSSGKDVLGYVIPQHYVFGEASAMQVDVGENGDDFIKDMVTVRGIAYADFGAKFKKAAAFLKDLSY